MAGPRWTIALIALVGLLVAGASSCGAGSDNAAIVVEPFVTHELPGENVFPEGIARDSQSGDLFVSSSSDGTIFRISEDGEVTTFSIAGADGRTSALGLSVDPARRHLWIAGGTSQTISVYDIDSGERVRNDPIPDLTPTSLPNDVVVDELSGDAYITDSGEPRIYTATSEDGVRLLREYTEDELPPATFDNSLLNGIDLFDDSESLLVVHTGSRRGFRVSRSDGTLTPIETDGADVGFDGVVYGRASTLHSMLPTGNRILRTRLSIEGDRLVGEPLAPLESPAFASPTTAAQESSNGRQLWVVNSQFGAAAAEPPFTVVGVELPEGLD